MEQPITALQTPDWLLCEQVALHNFSKQFTNGKVEFVAIFAVEL